VAGDGNQDMVWVIEALSKETERKQAAPPKSQAPSLDPTTGDDEISGFPICQIAKETEKG